MGDVWSASMTNSPLFCRRWLLFGARVEPQSIATPSLVSCAASSIQSRRHSPPLGIGRVRIISIHIAHPSLACLSHGRLSLLDHLPLPLNDTLHGLRLDLPGSGTSVHDLSILKAKPCFIGPPGGAPAEVPGIPWTTEDAQNASCEVRILPLKTED
ncbi:hypothetical protein K504DRAFT_232182 [Pleomassaria siparia CBS 279.74]|uniref:Uncharacterized protein n=1 Tax=Pleomassaria siparia CBS 279.74 TaxID=1314801 RepID=A0A6G1KHL9_9PLEO|nr:hypothetical protein K504DRAFT_232182 [Pleomassaria siparia CBS 279.74]